MAYVGGRLRPLFDPALASGACEEMARDGREAQMGYAKEYTPVAVLPSWLTPEMRGRKPGTLKDRWREVGPVTRVVKRGHPAYEGRFENYDPIAAFVENDTRPHEIRPSLARRSASVIATQKPRRLGDDPQAALSWLSIGGKRVFARVVKHPGTTGHHMTLKAATRAHVEFKVICAPALERWQKRVVRSARRNQPRGPVLPGGF